MFCIAFKKSGEDLLFFCKNKTCGYYFSTCDTFKDLDNIMYFDTKKEANIFAYGVRRFFEDKIPIGYNCIIKEREM